MGRRHASGGRGAGGAASGGEPRDPAEPTDFWHLYGIGAAIGFTPAEVDGCTPWEFMAAVDGYNAAHDPDPQMPPPTEAQHEALKAKYG